MTFKELPEYCYNRSYCEDEPKCPYKSLCTRFFIKTGYVPSEYYRYYRKKEITDENIWGSS